MNNDFIKNNFLEAEVVLENFLKNENNFELIARVGEAMVQAITGKNKIISCGNGGSMSDAMHFAEELTGRFRGERPGIPAIAISDPGFLTCAGNDYGYDYIFSRFIESIGQKGDVLLAISTSGNSKNILEAAKSAKQLGIVVVGLTGKAGGELAGLCDFEIRVPHFGFADRIQEMHIKIIHSLVQYIEESLYPTKK